MKSLHVLHRSKLGWAPETVSDFPEKIQTFFHPFDTNSDWDRQFLLKLDQPSGQWTITLPTPGLKVGTVHFLYCSTTRLVVIVYKGSQVDLDRIRSYSELQL